jgi:replicative DNA helicase
MKISEVLADTKSWLENMADNEYTGIRSGFTLIDNLTRGFNKSEMTLIAGRPSMGKTTFALNMAANIAFRQELPAAFFSPELSSRMLGARLLSAESSIDLNTMTSGVKSEREKCFDKINGTISQINNKPLFIEDISNMKLMDICARAREIHRKEKIKIIFIDSIDLIPTPHGEQTPEISRSIKELACELNIPVVVMSQMRRSGQRIRPRLSYLRYPSLGIYSDVVFLLHSERNHDCEKQQDTFKTSVTIAKNRSGPIGIIELAFYPKWYRFEEVKSP